MNLNNQSQQNHYIVHDILFFVLDNIWCDHFQACWKLKLIELNIKVSLTSSICLIVTLNFCLLSWVLIIVFI